MHPSFIWRGKLGISRTIFEFVGELSLSFDRLIPAAMEKIFLGAFNCFKTSETLSGFTQTIMISEFSSNLEKSDSNGIPLLLLYGS